MRMRISVIGFLALGAAAVGGSLLGGEEPSGLSVQEKAKMGQSPRGLDQSPSAGQLPERPSSYDAVGTSRVGGEADGSSLDDTAFPVLMWSQIPRLFDNGEHFEITKMNSIFKKMRQAAKSLVSKTESIASPNSDGTEITTTRAHREGTLFVLMMPRLITSKKFLQMSKISGSNSLDGVKEIIGVSPSWEFYPVSVPSVSFWDSAQWNRVFKSLGMMAPSSETSSQSSAQMPELVLVSEPANKDILSSWASSQTMDYVFMDLTADSNSNSLNALSMLNQFPNAGVIFIDLLALTRNSNVQDEEFAKVLNAFFKPTLTEPISHKYVSLLISPRTKTVESAYSQVFSSPSDESDDQDEVKSVQDETAQMNSQPALVHGSSSSSEINNTSRVTEEKSGTQEIPESQSVKNQEADFYSTQPKMGSEIFDALAAAGNSSENIAGHVGSLGAEKALTPSLGSFEQQSQARNNSTQGDDGLLQKLEKELHDVGLMEVGENPTIGGKPVIGRLDEQQTEVRKVGLNLRRRLQSSDDTDPKNLIWVKPSQFAMMFFSTTMIIFLVIAVCCLTNIDTPPMYREKTLQINKEF